ncbi:MAG: gephyrin-like molybdotransferase Glp [Gemmatimonadaceae bacterium]
MQTGLTVPEASERILADIHRLPAVRVPLREALGHVLVADIAAPVSLPPWDNASMDGYAVRAMDVASASAERPAVLRVVGTIAAGGMATSAIGPGEALRIMTGAPVPDGADSVVRVEDTDGGVERVAVRSSRDAGRNVRPQGEDLTQGDVAVRAGTLIGAAQLGVLASIGANYVEVYRPPRVAILSSGDELVDVDRFDEVLGGQRIVASNSYTLWALAHAVGAETIDLGIVNDDPAAIRARIEEGLSACDVLLTSGGVSVGAFDFTREVVAGLGGELRLWRVRMRPGAPIGFGVVGTTPWLGLPGNPVSAMVAFELFARPALRRMAGHALLFRRPVPVRLVESVTLAAPLMHFLRAVVTPGSDGGDPVSARLTGPQGSGLLTSMERANALVVVPADRMRVEAGEILRALLLTDEARMAREIGL